MLKAVESRRQVRETKMNQKSSRSHLVVRLYVESRPAPISGEDDDDNLISDDSSACGERSSLRGCDSLKAQAPVLSTINFVDLAGSERLSQASMADDMDREKLRQKEASNINVSLLTLGKVIRALGKRGEHVPYRESNLTRILQPSLSGNSRMAIVCTISPASGSVDNSRAALHFANHAKAVTMRPVMNEVRSEQALIHKMEAEIMELRRKLNQSGNKQLLAEKDAQIKAKEDQMRQALQEHQALKRRLAQMEKFIIRGGTTSPAPAVRRSFDDLESLTTSLAAGGIGQGIFGRGLGGLAAAGGGAGVRASWTPTNPSPLEGRDQPSTGKTGKGLGRSCVNPNRLLLDYVIPPNVREAVNRLRTDHAVFRMAASPANGKLGSAPDPASGFNLRTEIGKLQVPEGQKAQEALSALQAEVRYLSQQPEAAAAFAAAAGATPDTADRLLGQLTQMLKTMEQRQQDAHSQTPGSKATNAAAGPSASAAAGERGGSSGGGNASLAASPQPPELLSKQQQVNPEADASAIAYLKSEVARLERLKEINLQTNLAIESLLRKVEVLEQAGLSGSAQLDDMQSMPSVVERLHNALQEADALEEGEELLDEMAAARDDLGGITAARVNSTCTPAQRQSAPADDGEVTSAPRYDSPNATAQATTATTAAPNPTPSRLTGSKLPREQLDVVDDDEDSCAVLIKSPRRTLAASPHSVATASAAACAGPSNLTPNSRMPPAGCTPAGVEGIQLHGPSGSRPVDAAQHRGADSPRQQGPEGAEDLGLRRMRTPSVSVHASDMEPVSGGRRTASASSRGGLLRWDTERAKRIISREKDAIHAWYAAELSRLKAAFREEAQADVAAMQEAVTKYRAMFEETQERVERLNVQKQLLMKQVLHLELELVEAEQQEVQGRSEVAALKEELQRANESAKAAHQLARQAQAMALQHAKAAADAQLPSLPAEDPDDLEDWVQAPTCSTLLVCICDLWHKLHVPLVYRSRFFLHFRSKELIYLQMEQCRLKHRLEQMEKETDYLGRSKPLEKAKRALELERKVLAQGLRHSCTDTEREALYKAWEVPPEKKERKMRLVRKLWDPEHTKDEASMEMCARVVCTLAGPDATEQFMQLVFGNTAEACARPTQVGALVSTLVRRVTTPRPRKSLSVSGAVPTLTATSSGFYNNPGNAGQSNGSVTPRRQSTIMASIAGRMGSIMGQSGKPLGAAAPATGAGMTSAAGTPGSAVSGPVPQLPPNVPIVQAAGPGAGLGPMARGLANSGAFPNAIPPLPPPHPAGMMGSGIQAGPVSTRGRATYISGSSKQ
ncbi:hypothetical protein VaNZ11_001815 [Volvox africanus]|uniref:Kinesin motor domain-containing protein n=1 Tax=Volvox africanus TaxID=51714 RepID=A0ABQ5RQK9_9CHLO|nr:hypothetical protein VaNZ11_001815 [Volvox africanus]